MKEFILLFRMDITSEEAQPTKENTSVEIRGFAAAGE